MRLQARVSRHTSRSRVSCPVCKFYFILFLCLWFGAHTSCRRLMLGAMTCCNTGCRCKVLSQAAIAARAMYTGNRGIRDILFFITLHSALKRPENNRTTHSPMTLKVCHWNHSCHLRSGAFQHGPQRPIFITLSGTHSFLTTTSHPRHIFDPNTLFPNPPQRFPTAPHILLVQGFEIRGTVMFA